MFISDGYILVVAVGFFICCFGFLQTNTHTHTLLPFKVTLHTYSNPNIKSEMQGFQEKYRKLNKKPYSSKCSQETLVLRKCDCYWPQKTDLSFIPKSTACCNRNTWKNNCWNLTFCFSCHNYHFLHDPPNTLEFMLQQTSNSVAFLTPCSISNKDTDVKVRQN